MRIGICVFLIIICTLIFISCNTTEPPIDDDNLQPGRRDYFWTADTLWTQDFFGITDMWGSSPNSIWMVAGGTSAKDCLWYYNGVKWARYNQLLSPELTTVFGASSEEIWLGDAYGSIWRNRGSSWQKFQQLSLAGFDNIVIVSIYGNSANSLYIVGFANENTGTYYKGIILKYDGTNWKFLNIPDIRVGFYDIKRMKNGKYLISGDSDNTYKLFVFDGVGTLTEIHSGFYPGLNEMKGEVYISINNKIYKCVNDKLELWKEFPANLYYGNVLGRSEKDFFGSGYEGILHYNGTDLVNLYSTQLDLHGAFIFEKDVFFDSYNRTGSGYNYIMIRGTLKD